MRLQPSATPLPLLSLLFIIYITTTCHIQVLQMFKMRIQHIISVSAPMPWPITSSLHQNCSVKAAQSVWSVLW